MSKTKVATEQKYKAFSIYADMSKVDRTWERYGYLQAPLAVKKQNGELSTRSHKKQVVIYKDDFKNILSAFYSLVPHEFIFDTLDKYSY